MVKITPGTPKIDQDCALFRILRTPKSTRMMQLLYEQRILPAITFSSSGDVTPVMEALLKGGIKIMEVTLRTREAFSAIHSIVTAYPQLAVGAGTILNIEQLKQAIDAGASFGLSPSLNPAVVTEAARLNFPFIPGVMTPSEIELAFEHQCKILKLFPASCVGGISFLKALQGPYGHLDMKFIPMGGVNLQNMKEYLLLNNVIAVGGSWLAHEALIRNSDYNTIERNASEALTATART